MFHFKTQINAEIHPVTSS